MSKVSEVDRPMMFKRLSHRFTVRCNDRAIGEYVGRVLDRFAVRDAGAGARAYEVLDMGRSETQGRYRLSIDGRWVLGSGDPAHVLDDLFTYVNIDTMEATRDRVLVHAGAVESPEGVGVVLPAPSGSGKTTLVAGLVRSGFGYLSDEAAVLDPETGRLLPYAVHLSLKGASRDRFPEARPERTYSGLSGGAWHVDPDAIRSGAVAEPCVVGFVIAHRFEPDAVLRVEPLTPAEACVELAGNLMIGRRDTSRSLDVLAMICRASRGYRLTHGDLDAAVEAIVELTSA